MRRCDRGIQPVRLNAEGDSPSARSRGLSEAQPPGISANQKKSVWRTREQSPRKPIFAFFKRIMEGHNTEGFANAPPSATSHSLRSGIRPFRSRNGCVLTRIFTDFGGGDKRVIISLSKAVLLVGSGTPHRSLRSLCVVLTINQPLRGCAVAVSGHRFGDAEVIRQVRRGYALGYKLWFYDFFVNMLKWVWKCAK